MKEAAPFNQNQTPATAMPDFTAPQALELRDIHLPEPVSWWPIAPGWWLLLFTLCLLIAALVISRKIYRGKQLKRDIKTELERIKQQFEKTQNKSQLAKALSVLLRRASISFYPRSDIAGLTGEHWLSYLDESNTLAAGGRSFQSDTGRVLLSAPYLPDEGELEFNAEELIQLCESWLKSPHKKTSGVTQS